MDFIHHPYTPGETIAAIATPPGEGGVAIIRISGNKALEVGEKITTKSLKHLASHTAHFRKVVNEKKEMVDEAIFLLLLGKKSFTGEDTVEIHCHGGHLITRRVLEVVLKAGARQALPGEFTFKAFMNGKIDLAQAEAIQDLIHAKNERALDAAEKQLEGSLSKEVKNLQDQLNLMAAILEAWVDFPDEGLEFASFEEIITKLETLQKKLNDLILSFHEGKILHDGLTLCLIGAPNVGKSSLMNALLDKERAIVSPIPGTTRDLLEDHLRLAGLNFRIIDTAGIRDTEEFIEKEGIKRTRQAMHEADLILVVLDVQTGLETLPFLKEIPKEKAVFIWNKSDLDHPPILTHFPHQVIVSALHRRGLKELKQEKEKIIWKKGPPSKEEIVITNSRHKEALQEASDSLKALIDGLKKGLSPEFLTLEMRTVLQALGKILGTNVSEDILNKIFSTFCIGK